MKINEKGGAKGSYNLRRQKPCKKFEGKRQKNELESLTDRIERESSFEKV